MFTKDGIVPVIHGNIKQEILYIALVSEKQQKGIMEEARKMAQNGKPLEWLGIQYLSVGLGIPAVVIRIAQLGMENKSINMVVNAMQPMIDEICVSMIKEMQ